MNSYLFNSKVHSLLRLFIAKSLNIHHADVYKEVKNIKLDFNNELIVETQNNERYKFTLVKI